MNSTIRGAKTIKAAVERAHRAQRIIDQSEDTFNRAKERMQKAGTWDAYCQENGYHPDHTFLDTQA